MSGFLPVPLKAEVPPITTYNAVSRLRVHPGEQQRLFIALGGVATMSMGGVTMHLDIDEENHYIETTPGFSVEALVDFERIARSHGFEPMVGAEADEDMEDGRVRHWLAQIWFPQEESPDTQGVMIA